jgi:hypothetical protein
VKDEDLTYEERWALVDAQNAAGASWAPVDLTAILDGTYRPVLPTVGQRNDGVGLFYPGRIHTVASESEAGKTWFALLACRDELGRGQTVLYIDFEDDEVGVVNRLLAVGASRVEIAAGFRYVRPEEPVTVGRGWTLVADLLADVNPSLCITDGVTEAMSMHGLEMKDNTDVARFGKLLLRRIADRGPAVVALDHVTKASDSRGRYAIGAVHKLNGVNGAAYVLENRKPFGVGQLGKSTLFIAKDRPGQLRRHALPSREGLHWFADLAIDSQTEMDATTDLWPPKPGDEGIKRNTKFMHLVSEALVKAMRPLTKGEIEDRVTGRAIEIRSAIAALVDEQFIEVSAGPHGAKLHRLIKEFVDVGF